MWNRMRAQTHLEGVGSSGQAVVDAGRHALDALSEGIDAAKEGTLRAAKQARRQLARSNRHATIQNFADTVSQPFSSDLPTRFAREHGIKGKHAAFALLGLGAAVFLARRARGFDFGQIRERLSSGGDDSEFSGVRSGNARELRDVMSCDVSVISPDSTLVEAARKMRDEDVGILPVCSGDRIDGMITDRDIVIRTIANGSTNLENTRVRDAMSRDVVFCFEDQSLLDAARMMERKQIRRLIVLGRDKRLVGMVSLGDVSRFVRDREIIGDVMKTITSPTRSRSLESQQSAPI